MKLFSQTVEIKLQKASLHISCEKLLIQALLSKV